MTVWDFLDKHFTPIAILISVLCALPLLRLTGEPLERFLKSLLEEYRELLRLEPNIKSMDALGGIVIFVTVIAVALTGPLELLGGEVAGHDAASSETIARACLIAFGIVVEAAWFGFSITVSK